LRLLLVVISEKGYGMAATIWMGVLHVGDTGVPVKLHSAVSQNHIQFHLFHKTDKVQLRQQMVCAFEKKPVPAAEQVRGYQIDERRYVLIDPEELEQTGPEGARDIDIHEFVRSDEIDPVFRERTYYLEPDRSSQNYHALALAMKELEVDGVCTWVMRKRAFLGALHSAGNALRLNVLRYADEILPPQSLNL